MGRKIAFVTQRYGENIIGGSEWYARSICEYLHREQGWDVDVFTTTSQDYLTWDSLYPAGDSQINGVNVRRFAPTFKRSMKLFLVVAKVITPIIKVLNKIRPLRTLAQPLEKLYFILQGPYCPRLLRELQGASAQYEAIFFMTYLYYPTVYGLPLVASKAVLIPTAHHEPPFYFGAITRIMEQAQKILVNTEPEKKLVIKRAPFAADKIDLAGIGLELTSQSAGKDLASGQPYLLYLGRLAKGKGVLRLIKWFTRISAKYPDLQLYLAGQREANVTIPDHPGIRYLGFVSEEEKSQLIAQATCLVNPSEMESLSLIVVEAMMYQVPIIVNGLSDVLDYYAMKTDTVYSYFTYADFQQALDIILSTPPQTEALQKTKSWAQSQFSWNRVARVFHQALS